MNRMVAIVFQNFCQRGRLKVWSMLGLTNTVNVPVRYIEPSLGRFADLWDQVRLLTGGIRSRNQAAAGRRTDLLLA